jgi:hypothetical protein
VPLTVSDGEILIRAVTSWHVKKGHLDPSLFQNADDEVSVSRQNWIEPWLAKLIATLWIQDRTLSRPKLYTGLAFLSARDVRSTGSTVEDSRSEYLGHAHIAHGIAKQTRGEALPPQLRKMLNQRAEQIRNVARYVEDPAPESFRWGAT